MGRDIFLRQKMKISIFIPIFCLVIFAYLAEARPGLNLDRKGSSSSSSGESGSKSGSGSCSCNDDDDDDGTTATTASALPVRLSETNREDPDELADRKKKKKKDSKGLFPNDVSANTTYLVGHLMIAWR